MRALLDIVFVFVFVVICFPFPLLSPLLYLLTNPLLLIFPLDEDDFAVVGIAMALLIS